MPEPHKFGDPVEGREGLHWNDDGTTMTEAQYQAEFLRRWRNYVLS